jgi:hypothetical protein
MPMSSSSGLFRAMAACWAAWEGKLIAEESNYYTWDGKFGGKLN